MVGRETAGRGAGFSGDGCEDGVGTGKWGGLGQVSKKHATKVKRASGRGLTSKRQKELGALAALRDDQIDTSDIKELPPSAWKDAVRGRFYRPVKQAVSMRLDSDVIAWLRKRGKGYQTRANSILRQSMLADISRN